MRPQFQRGAGHGRVKKTPPRSRGELRFVFFGLGVAGLLFAGGYELYGFLLTWDELVVRTVEVLCPDPGVAARASSLVDGVAWGNILLLEADKVMDRLKTCPWVQASRVRKVFPATLRIEVAPRRPAAVLDGIEPFLIARDNVVLGPASSVDVLRFPLFRDDRAFAADRERKLERAWACLEDLGPTLVEHVETLDLSDPSDVVLVFRDDPTQIKLGDDLFRQRAGFWLVHRDRLRRAYGPMEYVDLRISGRTIFKPALPRPGQDQDAVRTNPEGTSPGEVRPPGL
jgi:cell division septal protein FtsQ